LLPDTAYYFQSLFVEEGRVAIAEITQDFHFSFNYEVIYQNITRATHPQMDLGIKIKKAE
jgi:hypothetical protein